MSEVPLIHRPGCHWALRLQERGGKAKEYSLGTHDRAEAVIKALREHADKIAEHKARIAARRLHLEEHWQQQYEPRALPYPGADGEQIVATERELRFYAADGKTLLRTERNGHPTIQLVGKPYSAEGVVRAFLEHDGEAFGPPGGASPAVTKSGDDAILIAYLDHRPKGPVTGFPRQAALKTWALFRQFVGGKPLRKWRRDDGRAFAAHFAKYGGRNGRPLKSASVHRALVIISAAIKFAKNERKLPDEYVNPFEAVVQGAGNDALRKEPLDEADMALIRANLHRLSEADRLLLRILVTTGCRFGEAWSIKSEKQVDGIRYFEVLEGKTEASKRRIPFPDSVLPCLPEKIDRPLFDSDAGGSNKRLNKFLRKVGITDPAKTVHSLRHRAITLLSELECPRNIQLELFGHAKSVHDKYIHPPMKSLQGWVDRIDGI